MHPRFPSECNYTRSALRCRKYSTIDSRNPEKPFGPKMYYQMDTVLKSNAPDWSVGNLARS